MAALEGPATELPEVSAPPAPPAPAEPEADFEPTPTSTKKQISTEMKLATKESTDWQQYKPLHQTKKAPGVASGLNKPKKAGAPKVFKGDHGAAYVTSVYDPATEGEMEGPMFSSADGSHAITFDVAKGEVPGMGAMGFDRPFVNADGEEVLEEDYNASQYQALVRRLRKEVVATKRRLQAELEDKLEDNMRLKAQVAALKENCDQQALQLQDQHRAFEEMRREGHSELQDAFRHNYAAERRAATMQARLGAAAADQERAFAAAASQLEALRRERDTLSEALAAVAEACVGGHEATPQEIAAEAEHAVAEGADPLPRRPDAWLRFNYCTPAIGARKNRPTVRGDGERAVAALVAAVARLKKRRDQAIKQESTTLKQVERLREVITRVDAEYQNVADMVEAVEKDIFKLQQQRGIPSLAPSQLKKGLPGRLLQVHHIAAKLAAEMEGMEAEHKKMEAQLLELDFYSKLHVKLVEQARTETSPDAPEPSAATSGS